MTIVNRNLSFFTRFGLLVLALTTLSLSSCTVDEKDAPYEPFNASETALHHIADANAFHIIGDHYLPLPCMLYAPDAGWTVLSSSAKFGIGAHGDGHHAIDRYVLKHGMVMRVADPGFPMGTVNVSFPGHHGHGDHEHHNESPSKDNHDGQDHDDQNHDHGSIDTHKEGQAVLTKTEADENGASGEVVIYNGKTYPLEYKSTLDGGLAGGGVTSFYDFSITKNVFTMILVFLLLGWIFFTCAKAYKTRDGKAPAGLQSVIEPVFLFLRDDVAKPMIGEKKYEKFMPFIMSLFFFILGLNLIGQIPFFPGSGNVSGNISVTIVLALFTFFITNLNGNADYWKHILWMPGIPAYVKIIFTPVELMGVFLKPLTLLVRLFANISAGHIVVISFVGLIFVFGDSGRSIGGSIGGIIGSAILTLFMMTIELLVAFIQAYIFAILSASYIGAAVEEHDHH